MTTLALGAKAPSFVLESLDGHAVALASYRGRRVLLAFLRNARCAVCHLYVHDTSRRASAWRDAGLDVIVVFESTVERLRASFGDRRPPFAVLADPDGRVHEAYGSRSDAARVGEIVRSGAGAEALARARDAGFPAVEEDGANFFRLPAEILVDEDGAIALLHVAEGVVDHLDPETVDRFARDGRCAEAEDRFARGA